MPTTQGDLQLLEHPLAQELLRSAVPARLAYVWTDGTPRVVPIWFHWDGQDVLFASPERAPKVRALSANPAAAVTIDSNEWPHKVLTIRGSTSIQIMDAAPDGYIAAAHKYFGQEQGDAWLAQAGGLGLQFARIALRPEWVGLIDFEQRFPNALEEGMEAAAARTT